MGFRSAHVTGYDFRPTPISSLPARQAAPPWASEERAVLQARQGREHDPGPAPSPRRDSGPMRLAMQDDGGRSGEVVGMSWTTTATQVHRQAFRGWFHSGDLGDAPNGIERATRPSRTSSSAEKTSPPSKSSSALPSHRAVLMLLSSGYPTTSGASARKGFSLSPGSSLGSWHYLQSSSRRDIHCDITFTTFS